MIYKIEKGDVFKCIKSFRMESGEKEYTKGKEYYSEINRCITDDGTDVYHQMEDLENFFEHFKLNCRKDILEIVKFSTKKINK